MGTEGFKRKITAIMSSDVVGYSKLMGDDEAGIFHGTADDWAPIEPCRKYVMRLRKHGKDVQLIEYPGALHVFDAPGEFIKQYPKATGLGTCELEERPGGLVVNRATGEPWKPSDSCATKGTTLGGNLQVRAEAIKSVKEFLTDTFKLNP